MCLSVYPWQCEVWSELCFEIGFGEWAVRLPVHQLPHYLQCEEGKMDVPTAHYCGSSTVRIPSNSISSLSPILLSIGHRHTMENDEKKMQRNEKEEKKEKEKRK